MTGILFDLDQRRLISRTGLASGGSIFFYRTGTSVKAPIYVDQALTIPMTNPVVVGLDAQIPNIYLDSSITYRRTIVYLDGSIDDEDPYVGNSAANLITTSGVSVETALDAKADNNLDNVTGFDVSLPAYTGTSYTLSPNWIPNIQGGVGSAVTPLHWHYSRINLNTGSSGNGFNGFSVTANIGGTGLNTVPELISAYAIYDTVSPNCLNPNIVPVQGRSIVTTDGRVSGGTLMSNFGLAGFAGGSPTGMYYNQCGIELDVGSNFAATSVGQAATRDAHLGGRSAVSAVSIGIQKGDVNSDGAFVVASGPQYMGGYQTGYSGQAGWRAGLLFTNALAPTGFGEPISFDGKLLTTAGTWSCATGIDLGNGIQFSGNAIELPVATNGSGGIRFGGDATIYRDAGSGLRFPAQVGFGKASVAPTTLPVAATDLPSALTLINAMRTMLINLGLAH